MEVISETIEEMEKCKYHSCFYGGHNLLEVTKLTQSYCISVVILCGGVIVFTNALLCHLYGRQVSAPPDEDCEYKLFSDVTCTLALYKFIHYLFSKYLLRLSRVVSGRPFCHITLFFFYKKTFL